VVINSLGVNEPAVMSGKKHPLGCIGWFASYVLSVQRVADSNKIKITELSENNPTLTIQ
jgi:hypothetical protein